MSDRIIAGFSEEATAPTTPVLKLHMVSKRYGRKSVLDRVTQEFRPGLTLLRGRSAGGKSTLMRLLATAERPSSGALTWKGRSLPFATKDLRSVLGYAPQRVDLPETLTAREFIMHIAALKKLALEEADAQFLDIADTVGIYPDVNQRIAGFSGGMRRRLVFAQALLGSPELLVLDEPTAELDADSADKVGRAILRASETAVVVMATHSPDAVAQHANLVLKLEDGGLHRT